MVQDRAIVRSRPRIWIAAGLALVAIAIYAPVVGYGFVDLDDGEYVFQNPNVLAGTTWDGVRWAITTFHAANWHPLTWLSHQLDVELYGERPGGHHATSLALHAVNAILVFLLLRAMTGATWASAAVAALWAAHPLRVESVAWVAERKDLLCAFFGLLALLAWTSWVRRRGFARYLAALALFALGLMAKPMLVTLPFLLLLLDVWPLARLRSRSELAPRLREKLPFFVVAALSCWVTYRAQASGEATASAESFPWLDRAANAAISYVAYLGDLFWPTGLAAFYPHPNAVGERVAAWPAALALALLVAVTVVALRGWRRRPWLAVGWLWYLGMLVPAIGLVQVGSQARADRYTYLPTIGILVALVWAVREWAGGAEVRRRAAALAALALIAASAVAARHQAGTWRDDPSLFGHAVAVTERNFVSWSNLGLWHLDRGAPEEALACFEKAVRAKPDYACAWYNAGLALNRMGEHERAVPAYRESLRLAPESADAWGNLGASLRVLGRREEAIEAYRRALAIRPGHPVAVEGFARLGLPVPSSRGATAPR